MALRAPAAAPASLGPRAGRGRRRGAAAVRAGGFLVLDGHDAVLVARLARAVAVAVAVGRRVEHGQPEVVLEVRVLEVAVEARAQRRAQRQGRHGRHGPAVGAYARLPAAERERERSQQQQQGDEQGREGARGAGGDAPAVDVEVGVDAVDLKAHGLGGQRREQRREPGAEAGQQGHGLAARKGLGEGRRHAARALEAEGQRVWARPAAARGDGAEGLHALGVRVDDAEGHGEAGGDDGRQVRDGHVLGPGESRGGRAPSCRRGSRPLAARPSAWVPVFSTALVVCAWAVASIKGVRQPPGDPATASASPERVVLLEGVSAFDGGALPAIVRPAMLRPIAKAGMAKRGRGRDPVPGTWCPAQAYPLRRAGRPGCGPGGRPVESDATLAAAHTIRGAHPGAPVRPKSPSRSGTSSQLDVWSQSFSSSPERECPLTSVAA